MLAEALLYVEIHMKTAVETNPASSTQCSIDDLYNIPDHIKVLHQVYTKLRDIDGKSNSVFHGLGVENENMYNNYGVASTARGESGKLMETVALGQTSWNSVLQSIENSNEKEKNTTIIDYSNKIKHLLRTSSVSDIDICLGVVSMKYE